MKHVMRIYIWTSHLIVGFYAAHGLQFDGLYRRVMLEHGVWSPPHPDIVHRRSLAAAAYPCSTPGLLADNDVNVAKYGSAWGLNSCADIVTAQQCASATWLPLCPVSCGVCSAPANFSSTFCHCFQSGWSSKTFTPSECWMSSSNLLPLFKDLCSAPWYTDFNLLPGNVAAWNAQHVLTWALIGGDDLGLPPATVFSKFLANYPIDGQHFTQIDQNEGIAMGFNVGEAFQVRHAVCLAWLVL